MKRIIQCFGLFFVCLSFVSTVLIAHSEQGANVTVDQSGVHVSGGAGATFLLLRIVGPDGRAYCDISSNGEPLNWWPSGDLPDGHYVYEVRQGYIPRKSREEKEMAGAEVLTSSAWTGSGGFLVKGGSIVIHTGPETGAVQGVSSKMTTFLAALGDFLVTPVYADVVHADDVIITGSECVGFDCLTDGTENFGFDTIRLKENNLRIRFNDTSSTAGFPANNWQIVVNDSSSGGLSYFSVEDSTASRRPFTIEAGARANALYLKSNQIGLGTAAPIVALHMVAGDTPAVRFDQDGTSGWTPQIWDMAGNESNFFIRDVTGGSKLPFRIIPGAPTNTLYLKGDGNVGIGTAAPDHKLHVVGDALITGNLELGSSRALKDNIRSLEAVAAMTALAVLNPVRFNYKISPDEESVGFIAEDVPDLVATKSKKSISTMDVVAVLTKVVQEQQKVIERLEKTTAELEKKVSNR
jgi:hypothetical protein